jgi:hypothetical protein
VPAHSVEQGVTLVVTTSSGTRALAGAYSFLNPIKVSPNTAPSTAPTVDVDVQGMGFMGINFGSTGNAGRVFLVRGVYDGSDAGGGVRANGPVAECVNVLPIADDELICTMQLNRRLNATGTGFFDSVGYTNSLTDVTTVAGSRVIGSDSGKFGPNDVGQPIVQATNANIPANSIVTSVLSTTRAVISAPATATSANAFAATIGNLAVRTVANALNTTAGSTTVTLSSGSFTRADVGRVLNNVAGVPAGTTIVAVAPSGTSATLSAPATTGSTTTVNGVTVADGATTINSTSLTAADNGGIIGPNSLGIPVGATISAVNAAAGTATISAAAVGGGSGSLTTGHPVGGSLYAGAGVPDGAYNVVVVSNGAPDAVLTDPGYRQTDVTSSSTFTVASF